MEELNKLTPANLLKSPHIVGQYCPVLKKKLMTIEDFSQVQHWCRQEGWNIGLYDSSIYFNTDTSGHYLFLKEGTPIGSMSLVNHSDNLFTIGPFIVVDSERGKGYGSQIWQKMTERLRQSPYAIVLLYSVATQVNRYKEEGFRPYYNNLRWNINPSRVSLNTQSQSPTPISMTYLDKIANYDQTIFIGLRKKALASALNQPEVKGFFIEVDNQLKGYGLIRPCVQGYRLGPLYADNLDYAKMLLTHLLKLANHGPVIIDLPEINPMGQQLMESIGATRDELCDTTTMVRGKLPLIHQLNIEKNYGLFSLEIG